MNASSNLTCFDLAQERGLRDIAHLKPHAILDYYVRNQFYFQSYHLTFLSCFAVQLVEPSTGTRGTISAAELATPHQCQHMVAALTFKTVC